MRLIQYRQKNGSRKVGLVTEDGDHVRPIKGVATIFELANLAIDKRKPLAKLAEKRATDERVDYLALLKAGRVLVPLDHPEPARFLVTGTGLTHLGSADARNKMHAATHGGDAPESDSMKIFRMGIKGGKPAEGFAKTPHSRPMLSLDNAYNEADLRAWGQPEREKLDADGLVPSRRKVSIDTVKPAASSVAQQSHSTRSP